MGWVLSCGITQMLVLLQGFVQGMKWVDSGQLLRTVPGALGVPNKCLLFLFH